MDCVMSIQLILQLFTHNFILDSGKFLTLFVAVFGCSLIHLLHLLLWMILLANDNSTLILHGWLSRKSVWFPNARELYVRICDLIFRNN